MIAFLKHFFIPHSLNNYKAKILHHSTLLVLILFLGISTILLNQTGNRFPEVLGISTNITSQELLGLANQKRQEENLPLLSLNPELSAAALSKANDMFSKNYWAHNSPDGKTPWEFIKEAGYSYIYAGENLARGFTTSGDVTNAWMASPSHRANVMSNNYGEVGFAVVTGKLDGEDTVLVVEEFGSRNLAVLPSTQKANVSGTSQNESEKTVEAAPVEKKTISQPIENKTSTEKQQALFASAQVKNKPLIDSVNLTTNFSIFIISLVVVALILEMVILERRKILSFTKHNPDHILFLISILILIFILGKGIVV